MAENYTVKPGVLLSHNVKASVKKIADKYYAGTRKKIVVTSGTRAAGSQATAMYNKLAGGDDLAVYKNQDAVKQIKKAYDDGITAKKSRRDIIAAMQKVIEAQIKKSVFISQHLREGAVDIRSRDMSQAEKDKFRQAAKGVAKKVILEATPPHFHLQF